jgi:hypothetical protein
VQGSVRPDEDAESEERDGPVQAPPIQAVPVSTLDLSLEEPEAWIARALARAHDGRLVQARTELQQLADSRPPAAWDARCRVELERIEGLLKLRELVLSDFQATGKVFRMEKDDKKHLLRFAELLEDRVVLSEHRDGLEFLSKSELPTKEIIEQASPEAIVAVGTWVRSWAECFEGDSRWKRRLVNEEGPAEVALKEDGQDWYPRALLLGRAALGLETTRALATYESPQGAQALAEAVQSLWKEHAVQDCIRSRSGPLRSLAHAAYVLLSQGFSPLDHLRGQVTKLEDDRVRVHYDFEEAEQELDFPPDDSYLAAYRSSNGELVGKKYADALHVSKGSLRGAGRAVVRHVLELDAPMTVRWQLRMRHGPTGDKGKIVYALGICGDAYERCIQASIFGWLDLLLPGGARAIYKTEGDALVWATHKYNYVLEHDGQELRFSRDGAAPAKGGAGKLTGGRTFIFLHSDHEVWMEELTIEGRVTERSLELRRLRWIEERLADLGMD